MARDVVPSRRSPWTRGLCDVADHGHGTRERASSQHAQLHRREVLHFVDHDVAEASDLVLRAVRRRRRWAPARHSVPAARTPPRGPPPPRSVAPGRAGRSGSGGARAGCGPRRSARRRRLSNGRHRATCCGAGTAVGPRSGSRIPLPAAARSGRAPSRSWRNSWAERRGHMRSSDLGHFRDAAKAPRQIVLLFGARRFVVGRDAAAREPGAVLVRECAHHLGLDEAPACVVRPRAALRHGDDLLGRLRAQPQHAGAERHLGVATQGSLACAHSACQHLDHAHVTLELARRRDRLRRAPAPRAPVRPPSTG